MGARVTPATAAVAKAKVEHRIHEYRHDPAAPSYGLEAAEQLGVDPAGVFKTLVAVVDGRLAVLDGCRSVRERRPRNASTSARTSSSCT